MILRDLQDIYSRKAPTSRNDLAYLANAITSPNNVNEQRSYWETVFQGFSPSLVELPTCRTTPRQLSDVAGQLVKHAQTPLLLSLGLLQTAAMTRHQFSRTARLVAGTLAASGACLSAFALARHSNIDTSVQATRTYCVFRDLVFGFSALQGLTMEKGLPLHMVLLACWSKVQARRSNNRDQGVVFGLLHNGRRLEGVEDIAAPCINVLPVYVLKPLEDDAFAVAGALQSDLRGRSAVVEQSRLQDVSSWVGAPGKPLFHYFVNMLRVPSAGGNSKPSTNILERIKVGIFFLEDETRDLTTPLFPSPYRYLVVRPPLKSRRQAPSRHHRSCHLRLCVKFRYASSYTLIDLDADREWPRTIA